MELFTLLGTRVRGPQVGKFCIVLKKYELLLSSQKQYSWYWGFFLFLFLLGFMLLHQYCKGFSTWRLSSFTGGGRPQVPLATSRQLNRTTDFLYDTEYNTFYIVYANFIMILLISVTVNFLIVCFVFRVISLKKQQKSKPNIHFCGGKSILYENQKVRAKSLMMNLS